jgi:outer membrane receptor for monomeric catechols
VDLLVVAGTSTRFGFGLTAAALQSTTLFANKMQLSDHDYYQYCAESEVEGVELDLDGHGDGF